MLSFVVKKNVDFIVWKHKWQFFVAVIGHHGNYFG